jgi:putative sugar O-methyltransferase
MQETNYHYPELDQMLADMENAAKFYQPTHFWRHGSRLIINDLLQHGVDRFRSFRSSLNFFVPTYAFPRFHQVPESYESVFKALTDLKIGPRKFHMMLQQFISGRFQAFEDYRVYLASNQPKAPYTDKVSESSIGNPVEQFEFDGRRFSRSMLNYLLGINFFKQMVKDTSDIRTVLEIGGGYGTLGEILLSNEPNENFYINVDIPPTSFISSYYLSRLLGEQQVGTYETLKNLESLDIATLKQQYRTVVLNSWQLPNLKGRIDLFVNFISFQEMEPDVVRNYLEHVDRLCAKYILLRNLREGKQIASQKNHVGVLNPIKGDDYDRFLQNYRLLGVNVVPFGQHHIDHFNSELRLYQRRQSR